MERTEALYTLDRTDAGEYEPLVIGEEAVGEMRWLERGAASGSALEAGLWRSDPATYEYLFDGDEAFYVLEGEVAIELPESGETIELHPGDTAYFKSGTRSVWRISSPFKKFTVIDA
jgi:uncharacterized cupin superfamily protein